MWSMALTYQPNPASRWLMVGDPEAVLGAGGL